jgi:hypothetical protein
MSGILKKSFITPRESNYYTIFENTQRHKDYNILSVLTTNVGCFSSSIQHCESELCPHFWFVGGNQVKVE